LIDIHAVCIIKTQNNVLVQAVMLSLFVVITLKTD